jgi:L-ascorbate metabolism protein UlaG (beta-lactamase superfamily)
MYRFTLEGINITHLGDVGNPLRRQMDALPGTDILLALAGGPPTIALADLHKVIALVKPKVVIPMHYRIPGPAFLYASGDGIHQLLPRGNSHLV